jgi:hypothetical protein
MSEFVPNFLFLTKSNRLKRVNEKKLVFNNPLVLFVLFSCEFPYNNVAKQWLFISESDSDQR